MDIIISIRLTTSSLAEVRNIAKSHIQWCTGLTLAILTCFGFWIDHLSLWSARLPCCSCCSEIFMPSLWTRQMPVRDMELQQIYLTIM